MPTRKGHGQEAGWDSAGSCKDVNDENKPRSPTAGLCIRHHHIHTHCFSCVSKMHISRERRNSAEAKNTALLLNKVAVFLDLLVGRKRSFLPFQALGVKLSRRQPAGS